MSVFEQERGKIEEALLKAVAADTPVEEALQDVLAKALPNGKGEACLRAEDPQSLTTEEKQLLEHSLCRVVDSFIRQAVEAQQPIMSYTQDSSSHACVPRLLDITLWLSKKAVSDGGVIFTVIEEIFEGSTLADCQEVFSWVESQTETLRQDALWKRGKLIMLRTCNEILRRLSKAHNTVLCGRILSLLAHFFPLSERSSLNLSSKCNTANTTKVEKDYDDVPDGESEPVDRAFHQTFWGLQTHFQNPSSVLQDAKQTHVCSATWDIFHSGLIKVLDVFESQPLRNGSSGSGLAALEDGETYCVKYLTSSKLLSLQLRDPAFRRHFLIQCLILLKYCLSPPRGDKDAVRGKQLEEHKVVEERVLALLGGMPPNGKEFLQSVQTVLDRELNWVLWKREGCAAFEREPVKAAAGVNPNKRKKNTKNSARNKLGNADLDCLWNLSTDNVSALALEKREHARVPELNKFFAQVLEEMDPENGFEEAYKQKNDKVFCWKAHRILAKSNLQIFSKMGPSDDLDFVAKQLYPEEVPASLQEPKTKSGAEEGEAPSGSAAGMDVEEAKAETEGGSNKRMKVEA